MSEVAYIGVDIADGVDTAAMCVTWGGRNFGKTAHYKAMLSEDAIDALEANIWYDDWFKREPEKSSYFRELYLNGTWDYTEPSVVAEQIVKDTHKNMNEQVISFNDVKATIDGREVLISHFNVRYESPEYDTFTSFGNRGGSRVLTRPAEVVVEITGVLKTEELTKKESQDMSENNCADGNCNDLATEALNLERDENKRLMIEHGVITETGKITRDGEKLLAQLLLGENTEKVVTTLKAIETAKSAKKK